jgi:NADH-quinone oxidoreductase subunit E
MLTEETREKIRTIQKRYPEKRSAVMDALMAVQRDSGGNLTKGDMVEIAAILDMKPVAVNEVAAFYTMYNFREFVGKYHIQVCRNISCAMMEAEEIIEHIKKVLGINVGETTKDNRFTLSTVECLGSCGTAPMMQINDDYHEDLTVALVDEILKGLE